MITRRDLGYHDVGGNDHLSTMDFVREAWAEPPDYFEPLVTLAGVATRTSVLRLSTAILMLPLRQSVLLAKQIITLDHLSGGRVTIGVVVGGYRDEFERVTPDLANASPAGLLAAGQARTGPYPRRPREAGGVRPRGGP
jgi:alkanesulfonate monooxygenase SsuD/methylene tetrahydromethanopterin reductase-like flavin-dependent oxidoreductase (luciferase family)